MDHPNDFWINYSLSNYLGRSQTRPKRLEESIRYASTAVALRPQYVGAYLLLARRLEVAGRLDEAIATLRKYIEFQPESGTAYTNLGALLKQQGKFDEAIAAYQKAIELYPEGAAFPHNNIGAILLEQGKLDEALPAIRKAIDRNPYLGEAHVNLGSALRNQGKWDEAIAACRKAIELRPDLAGTYSVLGYSLAEQGKFDEAIAAYRKLVELQPDNPDAHAALGSVLRDHGKVDEANAVWRKAIELMPKDANRFNNWAWPLATCRDSRFRDPERAVELATRAVELAPADGHIWNTLGVARYRTTDWQGAVEALRKSMELRAGGDASDWLFLAMAHWQLDHKDEARRWYDKAVEWIDKYDLTNEELHRFRAEATELLGISEPQPSAEGKPASDQTPSSNDSTPTTIPAKSGASSRRIPRQSGHAVEICIVAGQMDQTFRLHEGRHLRIAAEQPELLAEDGRAQHVKNADRNYAHSKQRNFFNDLPEPRQLLHLRQIALQTIRDPRHRPAERIGCFDRHHPVRHVADRTGGCNPKNLAARNSLKQLLARPLERGMRCEMIDERVGIDEHAGAGRDICERHGDSQMPNSGSSATRSIVSASPFQPNKPALARTRLTRHSASSQTVTCTFSCSASGSGWAGLSTPFSYTASTVIVMTEPSLNS
jgi:tetratricopeptide (TPR) repeat protein